MLEKDTVWIVIALGAAFVLYKWYVAIITKRNTAKEAFASIDVQLKKRFDLIPNILTIAKKYMEYESDILQEITKLRTQNGPNAQLNPHAMADYLKSQGELGLKMQQLMTNFENYPDLKSDEHMLHACKTYNEVEEQISAARRFYNTAVNQFNTSIQIFPGTFIARLLKEEPMPFFEAQEEERKPVNASDYLK